MEQLLQSFVRKVDLYTQTDEGVKEVSDTRTMCHLLSIVSNPQHSEKIITDALGTIITALGHSISGHLENNGIVIILNIIKDRTGDGTYTDLHDRLLLILKMTSESTIQELVNMSSTTMSSQYIDAICTLFTNALTAFSRIYEVNCIL